MKRERRQTNDNEKGNGPRVCEVPVATNPLVKVLSSWLLICFDASSPRVSLSVFPMVYSVYIGETAASACLPE
jgi:hypothetical protein